MGIFVNWDGFLSFAWLPLNLVTWFSLLCSSFKTQQTSGPTRGACILPHAKEIRSNEILVYPIQAMLCAIAEGRFFFCHDCAVCCIRLSGESFCNANVIFHLVRMPPSTRGGSRLRLEINLNLDPLRGTRACVEQRKCVFLGAVHAENVSRLGMMHTQPLVLQSLAEFNVGGGPHIFKIDYTLSTQRCAWHPSTPLT